MSRPTFQQGSSARSYIVTGSGVLPVLNQYTNAVELFIRGFSATEPFCLNKYSQLTNLVFDENLITINDSLILGTNVKTFTIPRNVKSLIDNPFDVGPEMVNIFVHPENRYFCDINGVLYSKDRKTLVYWPGNHGETEVVVPNFVEKLEDGAFAASSIITFIVIPSSVQRIGFQLFQMPAVQSILILNKNLPSFNITLDSSKSRSILHFMPLSDCSKCKDRRIFYSEFHIFSCLIILQ
ncbi:cell surface protein, putative [Trichomonas vaginalis G3]|uniref:Cell surface protein, putative n=1 Tax=Trichomonas vaginalis (strain ATCC PRA-98 / G3) TaxID=412133 RepID=A2DTK0_TRIV3|nr:ribonuclease inhibitor domain-containing protein [Trichomonas vaginalis G3]EAY16309.1 cell surface protein, putative [Trichomonas vaginalis G3]KAI5523469.1 ribonuclease inhibitor domain-containing protein [Trichomonas vaginalis G3]|eukprot:XP_001328532.1 cell surface protein [Trichomonas vaginalis G3]